MKILVLGNSHVAALRSAYGIKYSGNNEYYFIARPQGFGGLNGLKYQVESDRLLREDITGFVSWEDRPLSEYDAFVFVGYRVPYLDDGRTFYSSAILKARYSDVITERIHLKLAVLISESINKKVYIISHPFQDSEYRPGSTYDSHQKRIDILNDLIIGSKIDFLPIPELVVETGHAKMKSIYLKDDGAHGNEEYGAVILSEIDMKLADI
ncbi:hypothetical protein [Oceanobacter mangrovi]|uniref:hypothetical protein n=1 Tax=Oceanobacter mangrovi TaxID=2862510 RepID=UPI001C8E0CF2|nr:hypothetical protein [Oceanobacter mangrovi]